MLFRNFLFYVPHEFASASVRDYGAALPRKLQATNVDTLWRSV